MTSRVGRSLLGALALVLITESTARSQPLDPGPRAFASGDVTAFRVRATQGATVKWKILAGPATLAHGTGRAEGDPPTLLIQTSLPDTIRDLDAVLTVQREGTSNAVLQVPFQILARDSGDLRSLFKKHLIGLIDLGGHWAARLVQDSLQVTALQVPHAVCRFKGDLILLAGTADAQRARRHESCLTTYAASGGAVVVLGEAGKPDMLSELLSAEPESGSSKAEAEQSPSWLPLSNADGPRLAFWRPDGQVFAQSALPLSSGNLLFGKNLPVWGARIGDGWVWACPALIPEKWAIEPSAKATLRVVLRFVMGTRPTWRKTLWLFDSTDALGEELAILGAPVPPPAIEPDSTDAAVVALPFSKIENLSRDVGRWWANLDRWVQEGGTLFLLRQVGQPADEALLPDGPLGKGEIVRIALTIGEVGPSLSRWGILEKFTRAGVKLDFKGP